MFDFNRNNNRFMNNGGQPSLGNFRNTQNRQNSYGLNNMSNAGQQSYSQPQFNQNRYPEWMRNNPNVSHQYRQPQSAETNWGQTPQMLAHYKQLGINPAQVYNEDIARYTQNRQPHAQPTRRPMKREDYLRANPRSNLLRRLMRKRRMRQGNPFMQRNRFF